MKDGPAEISAPMAPLTTVGDAGAQMAFWLVAAALHLADWLDRNLPALAAKHPHLSGYRAAAAEAAPGLPTRAWPGQLAASDPEGSLPMGRAARALGLSDAQRLAHATTALAEEDARVGALLSELQGGSDPYPSVETLARVFGGPVPGLGAGWDLVSPMIDAGLLAPTRAEGPRAGRTLAPVAAVWDIARGATRPALPEGIRIRPHDEAPHLDALAHDAAFCARLARLPGALGQNGARRVLLRAMPGSDDADIAAALAREMGRDLLLARTAKGNGKLVGAIAILTGAIPCLHLDPAPGEAVDPPRLGAWEGPVLLRMGRQGGLAPDAAAQAVTVTVPFPGPAARERAWRAALGDTPVAGMAAIRDGFQIPLGHIRRIARAGLAEARLAGRSEVTPGDMRVAARALGREQLDGLADALPGGAGWSDLIAPPDTRALLGELATRCAHRERLPGHMGTSRDGETGRGVRALFSGPSGTGKTLAARLLGGEIGQDVYRVDLSAVIDKYVGETEKRLDMLLARAEALDVILLLDEGDGLMAQRTDVRSANDRFANTETNFLLQRLESHEGIVVVTTNAPDGIDPAFQRRIEMVVPFPRPDMAARRALWAHHLPEGHAVGADLLDRIAARVPVTGGQVRNAVRAAASRALTDNAALSEAHLLHGLDREMQKTGAVSGLRLQAGPAPEAGQLAAFAAQLAGKAP